MILSLGYEYSGQPLFNFIQKIYPIEKRMSTLFGTADGARTRNTRRHRGESPATLSILYTTVFCCWSKRRDSNPHFLD